MRTLVIATALAATLSAAAWAQSAPPATPPAAPSRPPAAAPPASTATPSTPKVDCRAQAQSKGLRGQEMRDAVAVCVQEQRLACVKEAVEKKIVGPARRDFVRDCAGRPSRGDKG